MTIVHKDDIRVNKTSKQIGHIVFNMTLKLLCPYATWQGTVVHQYI